MEAYFTVESISRQPEPNFHTLRTRLIAAVNARLQNGEFTERGLARILRASQPHVHNVLKGTRTLQWDLADRLIAELGIKMLDLWTEEELASDQRIRLLCPQGPASRFGDTADTGFRALPRREPQYEIHVRQPHRAAGI
jgi:hypothetical protein